MDRGIFVKLNYKNIGELNSFVYDCVNGVNKNKDKYVMCAGKYDKEGWTIVFKAKNIKEAEELVSINSARREEEAKKQELVKAQLLAESERVTIPAWLHNN